MKESVVVVQKAGESSGTSFSDESKRFMKRWVYFGELVVKELTLHSAPSFGIVERETMK